MNTTAAPTVLTTSWRRLVGLWRPLRARFGSDMIRGLSTPLVGREFEMVQARTLFDYSLLRTIEDGFGLGYLGGAKTTEPITGIWA